MSRSVREALPEGEFRCGNCGDHILVGTGVTPADKRCAQCVFIDGIGDDAARVAVAGRMGKPTPPVARATGKAVG